MKSRDHSRDPLEARAIAAALGERAGTLEIEVLDTCTSTNALLLARAPGGRARLLAAEVQTAGRGRRGRRWHSARGAGLTFSLARLLRRPVSELAGLSLAAGVGVARALRELGANEVALKWPNDLVARGAKLGGILAQTRTAADGVLAVIGVGINCRADAALQARLRRRTVALEQLLPALPARNRIAGCVARAMLHALECFEAGGLAPLRSAWEALHAHAGERIRVRLADGHCVSGIASGLADDGALRLLTERGVREVHAASIVNARPA